MVRTHPLAEVLHLTGPARSSSLRIQMIQLRIKRCYWTTVTRIISEDKLPGQRRADTISIQIGNLFRHPHNPACLLPSWLWCQKRLTSRSAALEERNHCASSWKSILSLHRGQKVKITPAYLAICFSRSRNSVVAMPLVPLSMDEHRDKDDRRVSKGNAGPHLTMLYRGKPSGRCSRFPKSGERPMMRTRSIARR